MHGRWIAAALLAGLALGWAGSLSAQQRQRAPGFERDPNLNAEDQLAPSQMEQTMPAAVAEPTAARGRPIKGGARARRRARAAAPRIVACSGVFAKDSSHRKLAMAFGSRNIAYTQVDAAAGGKVMASVLYAKDPKRRLEIWWSDPISRSGIHLIDINGQSGWAAPGGLHIGLTLAELQDLNGKPFKLLGFNKDKVAALSGWNGGKVAAPAGGCKIGVSFRASPNTPPSALAALAADHEYTSTADAPRAVNPAVSEILIGY